MIKITLSRLIKAPKDNVWSVITNTDDYPVWNKFIVECNTTFEPGTPITMKVKLIPFITIKQKEKIWECRQGKLIDYRTHLPLGMLSSTRQHVLKTVDEGTTKYDSVFVLKGWLSPFVKLILERQLRRSFADMTDGIVSRSVKQ